MATYVLADVEERNRQHPDTFPIPPRELRDALKPGDHAKLVFRHEKDGQQRGERMWVLIKAREDSGYVGTLANVPDSMQGLHLGDRVTFLPEHVIDVLIGDR